MATARKKNGKWYYRITITVGDGSHKYIERGSWKTKKEALEAGSEVEYSYKVGDTPTRQKYTSFSFLADEWLESAKSLYRLSTIHGYEKELRNTVLPILGDYNLTAISLNLCQSVVDKALEDGHTRSRLSRVKACMNQCFKYAIRNNYIFNNPAKDVLIPLERSVNAQLMQQSRKIRPLTDEEIEMIFDRFPEGHSDYLPMLLGYRCGLRLGEAFGLLVEDIDLASSTIHIRRQIQFNEKTNELYFASPKYCNPGEERIIYLDSDTCMILRKQIDRISQCAIVMHYPEYYISDTGILNTENGRRIIPLNLRIEDGTYISPRTMQHTSRVIHGLTGKFPSPIPDFEFHMLRHTHASELIANGVNPVSVQMRLGHKRLETTYRYYVHETNTQVTQSRAIIEKMYS